MVFRREQHISSIHSVLADRHASMKMCVTNTNLLRVIQSPYKTHALNSNQSRLIISALQCSAKNPAGLSN